MVKSGLIMGVVMLVLALGTAAVIMPLCTPCVALFVGLAAGYLAGVFDKPLTTNASMRKGAIAGAIAGAIGILGQIGAGFINASVINPATLNQIIGQNFFTQQTLWVAQIGVAFCLGLFNVALMAGLGVGGAAIWSSTRGRPQMPLPPTYP